MSLKARYNQAKSIGESRSMFMRLHCILRMMTILTSFAVGLGALAQDTKKGKVGEKDGPAPVFAFVVLNKVTPITVDQIQKDLEASLSKTQKVTDITIKDGSAHFSVDGRQVAYMVIDKPIPWSDLGWSCEHSWMWRDATKKLKPHKAHVVVAVFSDRGSHLERNVLLTKVLAAATRTFDAAGVYWGHASLVVSPEKARKMADDASIDEPPVLLWVNFIPVKSPGGALTVVTEGLDYFDCMDIEVTDSKRPFADIMSTMMGVAYILLKGEVIKDGDTIGPDNKQKIKTRHAKSGRDDKKTVLKIEL